VTLEQAVGREETADELLGELAHELSHLVRTELEVAAADRGPGLQRVAVEVAAALALRVDHPRRLWRRFTGETHEQAMAMARADRAKAEADVRAVAERLTGAISVELRAHEARAIIAGEKRLVGAAERDAAVVFKELMSVLAAPGRAGVNLLERLLEGKASRQSAERGRCSRNAGLSV
jgi:hypothetical protein